VRAPSTHAVLNFFAENVPREVLEELACSKYAQSQLEKGTLAHNINLQCAVQANLLATHLRPFKPYWKFLENSPQVAQALKNCVLSVQIALPMYDSIDASEDEEQETEAVRLNT
jgi:hypothetical protein